MKKIAVIGAGTMGAGIAQVAAEAGYQVSLRDIKDEYITGAFRQLRSLWAENWKKAKSPKNSMWKFWGV